MSDTVDVHLQDASKFADAHQKPSVLVPVVRATAESLIGYGTIVPDFEAEEIIRVTWPKLTGSRPVVSGTGDRQVCQTVSLSKIECLTGKRKKIPPGQNPPYDRALLSTMLIVVLASLTILSLSINEFYFRQRGPYKPREQHIQDRHVLTDEQ